VHDSHSFRRSRTRRSRRSCARTRPIMGRAVEFAAGFPGERGGGSREFPALEPPSERRGAICIRAVTPRARPRATQASRGGHARTRAQIIRATRREIATFHAARRRKRSGTRMTYAFTPMPACNYGFIENDASPRCFVFTPATPLPLPLPPPATPPG